MTIKNAVSNDFLSTYVDVINIYDCSLPGVSMIKVNILESPFLNLVVGYGSSLLFSII